MVLYDSESDILPSVHAVIRKNWTREEMLGRVVRFGEVREDRDLFLDCALRDHERSNFMLLGPNTGWDDPQAMPARLAEEICVGVIKAAPGKGPGLHSHSTEEVFLVLSGEWELYWGEQGENQVRLGERDLVSVPAGVWRGLRNAGTEEAYIAAIHAGSDAGEFAWHPSVLEEARGLGRTLDEERRLVRGKLPSSASASS